MWKFVKWSVFAVGLVALSQVPGVKPLVAQAQAVVSSWVSKATPTGPSIQAEMAGIESRLAQIDTASEELAAAVRRSESEASRLGDLLNRTKGDIVVVNAEGDAREFGRDDLALEQAVFVVTGAAAKMQQASLAEEAGKLREKHRELQTQSRRETAKAVAGLLQTMPRAEGKSLAGDKR